MKEIPMNLFATPPQNTENHNASPMISLGNAAFESITSSKQLMGEHIFHYGFGFCGKTVLIGCDKINNDDVNGKEL